MTEQDDARTAPRIAKLLKQDLGRCAELEQILFPGDDPWSRAAFVSELDQGHYYIGAYDGAENLLGYGGLAVRGFPPDVESEVHTIGVDPSRQRRGVGSALLRALLARADEIGAPTLLEVRTDNEAAITLYREHGFEFLGRRRGYYQPSGADAYTMRRPAQSAVEELG